MSKINNPHDIFTKIMLSEPGAARVVLRRYLPVELSNKLDFRTLKPVDKSFLSDDMKESFADLVFEYLSKLESKGNLQTTYYVYLFDLLKEKKEEIMQKYEETMWSTADRQNKEL